MKSVWNKVMLFVFIVAAMGMVSCASSGSGNAAMGAGDGALNLSVAEGRTESEVFAGEGGNTLKGYYQVLPLEGMDSRYKMMVTGAGADGQWMTGDDEVKILMRETFTEDGRLLSVETYDGLSDVVVERLENIGFNEAGMPVEQVLTKDGERFRTIFEYNEAGDPVKATHYDGATLVSGVDEFIWNHYWDGDVFVSRRYDVTSHGTATPDFVVFRYADADKAKLLEVDVYSEEGVLEERVVPKDGFEPFVFVGMGE